MIVQACINGSRPAAYHPRLPLTTDAMAEESLACIKAGASELHIHPRAAEGRESLAAADATVARVRRSCPGKLIGVSTGAWIESDEALTRRRIAEWRVLPDYASVNLSENDAPAIVDLLLGRGIGVEAGLATIADARRFVALPNCRSVLRILVEIEELNTDKGDDIVKAIAQILEGAGVRRPILLHGFDATVWHFVRQARVRGWSTRVGLEDGCLRADGGVAKGNADLIRDAVAIFQTHEA